MSEVIRVRDQYYILATSPLADTRKRVLKQGDTFAIFDMYGDVRRLGRGEQGIYHNGTRFLSRSALQIGNERPLLLGSSVASDNIVLAVDLTNPDMTTRGAFVPRGTVHIFRSIFLWRGSCYERLRLVNYGESEVDIGLSFDFEADFADIFEVRGVERDHRGEVSRPEPDGNSFVIAYAGLDGVERRTRITGSEEAVAKGTELSFNISLAAAAPREFFITVVCEEGPERRKIENYSSAVVHQREAHKRLAGQQCEIHTNNELFNAWIDRSLADLRMMITDTEYGPFPYAGVPWFSTPFGRDAIITAYQMLWVEPTLARGVLSYLAATQAQDFDAERHSEPGKILHELRAGECANLNEVPFGRYYGSVDGTPLYVVLAGEYYRATGDIDFIRQIWPNIDAALRWIDTYGDSDGDGFVEYLGSERGLVQQGWKDSHDSVFHADGSIPPPPIALCEVQAYVHWARREGAALADALGMPDRAAQLIKQAAALKEIFDDAFWSPEIGTYALALDGNKRPCLVRSSNAGHCLLGGISTMERARLVASSLLSDSFFSGWGVRTLATTEARYGPITYHNGSIWPHDNSLVGHGLAQYGFNDGVHRIMGALLDASVSVEFQRLPELYCGFPRRPAQGPIEYPLACAPQAWASGSVFLLLRACLGLNVQATSGELLLSHPTLPPFLKEVEIKGLRVGDASVDLLLHGQAQDVATRVSKRDGNVEVVIVK